MTVSSWGRTPIMARRVPVVVAPGVAMCADAPRAGLRGREGEPVDGPRPPPRRGGVEGAGPPRRRPAPPDDAVRDEPAGPGPAPGRGRVRLVRRDVRARGRAAALRRRPGGRHAG